MPGNVTVAVRHVISHVASVVVAATVAVVDVVVDVDVGHNDSKNFVFYKTKITRCETETRLSNFLSIFLLFCEK